jgi:hypothetical protein
MSTDEGTRPLTMARAKATPVRNFPFRALVQSPRWRILIHTGLQPDGPAQSKETVSTVCPFRPVEVTRSYSTAVLLTADEQTVKTVLHLLIWFITG